MQKHKLLFFVILVNILLGVLFILSNFSIYNDISSNVPTVSALNWSPWIINAPHYGLPNENVVIVTRTYSYFNYPFWMFFVLMFLNLLFMFWLAKSKSSNP
jgi:hypothetical protein